MNNTISLKVTVSLIILAFLFVLYLVKPTYSSDWRRVGGMDSSRSLHSMTLLSDGRVLIAGGNSSEEVLSSVEIYDPTTETWSTVTPMSTPRAGHTATLLQNNKILITGGYSLSLPLRDKLSSVEIYDPSLNTWSSAQEMLLPRAKHISTLLQDGRVLITGGYDKSDVSIEEVYDPDTNLWSLLPAVSSELLYDHRATLLNDGRVLVTGGVIDYDTSPYIGGALLFDPNAKLIWTSTGPFGRAGHSATLLANGKVLITGGWISDFSGSINDPVIFDPSDDSWSDAADMLNDRYDHEAVLMADGRVMVAGGEEATGGIGNYTTVLSNTEIYDPSSNSWESAPRLISPRKNLRISQLTNDNIYISGGLGITCCSPLSTADLFDFNLPNPFAWELFQVPINTSLEKSKIP